MLERACRRVESRVGADDFDDAAIPALVTAATDDPDGFRLVFRHAVREPEFREITDALVALSVTTARRNLARHLPDSPWLDWAAHLLPTLATEAVIAWLDAGCPDPDHAPDRIGQAVHGVIAAAASPSRDGYWGASPT